ncbi:MAG TPA: flagellar basal body-associated FliL family protein [Symbiobacteriaceae bacterium]|nr:flagellar basal body-associated FliL family protein [Symbiobacteriaceae bacterium]
MNRGAKIALIGAVVVLTLGLAGLATYVFTRPVSASPAPAEQAADAQAEHAEMTFLKLKNFVTDLKMEPDGRMRYVDVTIALGLKDEAALETGKKLEPLIRDIIVSQLRTRTASDLLGNTGKEQLAEGLKEPLAQVLKTYLKAVYITDLVVQ